MSQKFKPPQNRMIQVADEVHYSGPLPPAVEFNAYNVAVPGAGERLLRIVENQTANRIKNEQAIVAGQVFCEKAGLIMGFLITLAALGVAAVCAMESQPITASIIGVGGIAALAGVFVYGSKRSNK